MYVHQSSGLIYLANPRTASRATAKALLGIGFTMEGSHHSGVPEHLMRPGLRETVGSRDVVVQGRGARGHLVFTTVRDLRTTIRSWARKLDIPASPEAAGEALDRVLERQLPIIEGWEPWTLFPHARHADVLLRYEHLDDDLNQLLEEHGLGPVELEVIR